MLFEWLKRRRRRRILAASFPAAWREDLQSNVAYYVLLSDAEQARLRDDLSVFVAEKRWEGCGGLIVTDEIKVTIAAQACILLLGMEHDYYALVPSILVYPGGYLGPSAYLGATGVIYDESSARLGESWYRGPVVLSWADVLEESRHPECGTNVALHEFAHQLDMLDGAVNGTPPLQDDRQSQEWREVMTAEYQRLIRASERGRATLLDEYGATSEGEFFAVATECFFLRPVRLRRRHPQLYEVLRAYYRQDPAARFTME